MSIWRQFVIPMSGTICISHTPHWHTHKIQIFSQPTTSPHPAQGDTLLISCLHHRRSSIPRTLHNVAWWESIFLWVLNCTEGPVILTVCPIWQLLQYSCRDFCSMLPLRRTVADVLASKDRPWCAVCWRLLFYDRDIAAGGCSSYWRIPQLRQ